MKESRLAGFASWAVLGASFGLSATTWVALAVLAGFSGSILGFHITWLMPVAVDGYVVVALVVWMSPVPPKVASFAKANTYASASIGVAAQSAYHALTVWTDTQTAWRAIMAAVVGALPPAVAALTVHLRALLRRELQTATRPQEKPAGLSAVAKPTPAPKEPVAAGPEAFLPVNDHRPGAAKVVELDADKANGNGKRGPVATTEELYEQARQMFRRSVADGRPLTGDELGDKFGKSGRWGRDRIAEARQQDGTAVAA